MSRPTQTREYRLPKRVGIHNLVIQTSPIPSLRATQVLVKVYAVSLQYRDLLIAKDQYPVGIKENVVPGSDFGGEIIALGEDVAGWKIGDRVCANFALDHVFGDPTAETKKSHLGAPIDGVLTEYKILPAHSLVRIPDHLSYEEASTLPCAALTAYSALLGPTPLKGGDTVLILGTGGVSIFGLQFAVASGATVIVTSSSDEKLQVATRLGAKYTINYNTNPDWDQEVLELTNGQGVDHVLEVGGAGSINKSLACARYGGCVHNIGVVAGTGDVSTVPSIVLLKALTLRGITVGSRTQFEEMNRLIIATSLRPVIDKVFAFEELQEACRYLESQKHMGKVVVKVCKD
ncbi:NAD(P)-binding protein [Wolfiporia cocos MD-104 SS10]|uniref:NAD(P)-binding protein n=1 Tax=Wolfiporia cocos (strain MD-104) TaxID=742152 RepID=A0A2H3JPS9_WOLCO|nr:NAD(P)-binding protein [Wolfiporia cocos MD-104 SS10]